MDSPSKEVTQLLLDWKRGNNAALDQLTPLVYQELRRLAQSYLRRERSDHTLQATALIHEAYVRLVDQGQVEITQAGRVVDPSTAKGPIRIRLTR